MACGTSCITCIFQEQILMAELHGILEPDFLQTAEGNCKVLVSFVQKKKLNDCMHNIWQQNVQFVKNTTIWVTLDLVINVSHLIINVSDFSVTSWIKTMYMYINYCILLL